MADNDQLLQAVTLTTELLAHGAEEARDNRKTVRYRSAAELRELIRLQCEAANPDGKQMRAVMEPDPVKL